MKNILSYGATAKSGRGAITKFIEKFFSAMG